MIQHASRARLRLPPAAASSLEYLAMVRPYGPNLVHLSRLLLCASPRPPCACVHNASSPRHLLPRAALLALFPLPLSSVAVIVAGFVSFFGSKPTPPKRKRRRGVWVIQGGWGTWLLLSYHLLSSDALRFPPIGLSLLVSAPHSSHLCRSLNAGAATAAAGDGVPAAL